MLRAKGWCTFKQQSVHRLMTLRALWSETDGVSDVLCERKESQEQDGEVYMRDVNHSHRL